MMQLIANKTVHIGKCYDNYGQSIYIMPKASSRSM